MSEMKENGINVVSLFDGMSCLQQALERCNVKVNNYYASEIDKYAMQVTTANYPNTIQLGSVTGVDGYSLGSVQLLAGGSPCQSFSFAGKRKGMSTKCEIEILSIEHYLELKEQNFEFEGQSYLFWEYIRILNEVRKLNPNVYFLLENVMMGEKWEKILSKAIGVNPIEINSALVSAQNRRRLYWTNIGLVPSGLFGDLESIITQPKDKGILLKDILETDVAEKYYLSDKIIATITRHGNKIIDDNENPLRSCTIHANYFKIGGRDQQYIINKQGQIKPNQNKSGCFTAGGNSGGNHSDMDLIVHNMMPRSSKSGKGGTGHLSKSDGKTYCLDTNTNTIEIIQKDNLVQIGNIYDNEHNSVAGRVYTDKGKSVTLSALGGGGGAKTGLYEVASRIRRLTPMECERLQTVKDNYTNHVSDTQRYKMLGNGWTVDVIVYILSFMHPTKKLILT